MRAASFGNVAGIAHTRRALAEKTEALLPQLLDLDLTGCPAITVDYPSEPVVRAILAQNKF